MKITVFDTTKEYKKCVATAVRCLNDCQDQFVFEVKRKERQEGDSSGISRAGAMEIVQEMRAQMHQPPDAFCMAIIEDRLKDNWFSFVNHPAKSGVITISGWTLFSHFPMESFLAMELIQNLQEFLLKWTDGSYAHERPRGCLNDLCVYKRDISLKLQSGYVCPDCLKVWEEKLSPAQIRALTESLDKIREFALGRLKVEKSPEEQLVYPVAVIWRMLRQEREPSGQFSRLLDLFDMAVRFSVIAIVADFAAHAKEAPIEGDVIEMFKEYVGERPSLGDWVNALTKLCACAQSKPDSTSFGQQTVKSVQNAARLIEKHKLVRLRNETKGHALTLPPNEYQRLYAERWPEVLEVLSSLTSILSLKLVTITRAEYIRLKCMYQMHCKSLMGSNSIFEPFEFLSSQPLQEKDVVFLRPNSNSPVSLYELVRWSTCPVCGHEVVLISDDDGKYLDPAVGHRVELSARF